MNFWQLILPESRKAIVQQATQHTDADPIHSIYETQIFRKDGKVRRVEVTLETLRIDGQLAALITAVDITERKHVEARSSGPSLSQAAMTEPALEMVS